MTFQEATIQATVVHSAQQKQVYPERDDLGQSSPQKSLPAFPAAFQTGKWAGACREKSFMSSTSSAIAFPLKGKKLSPNNQALCFASRRWLNVVKPGLVILAHKDEGRSWAFLFLCIYGARQLGFKHTPYYEAPINIVSWWWTGYFFLLKCLIRRHCVMSLLQ